MSIDIAKYKDFGSCIRLANSEVEILVTTDIGPRIISYSFIGQQNMLSEIGTENRVDTELGTWHVRGGHRLWHAPEAKPRSYSPDNAPVEAEVINSFSVKVSQSVEPATGIAKEMLISLAESGSKLTVQHKLTNTNLWPVEFAPWALTVMRSGGRTIIPQEPFIPHTEKLLPARPMVLWNYTDLSDSRWHWGKKLITLRCDCSMDWPQKIGVANKQGWAGYTVEDMLFIKKFPYMEGANYPDHGCNFETFTSGDFMEVESLGPLEMVEPGACLLYTETWHLFRNFEAGETEESLETAISEVLASTD